MARILTSKIETSGQRFLNRRIDQAVTQRDSRMFHAPMNVQAASVSVGLVLSVLWVAVGFFLAWLKPQTTIEANKIGQLNGTIYVLINGKLHEVYNMASARLIQGSDDEPEPLKPNELAAYPRGLPLGILDAPTVIRQSPDPTSHFTVCYSKTVMNSVTNPVVGTSVLVGPLTNPQQLSDNDAVLVRDPYPAHRRSRSRQDRVSKFWVLYKGQRSKINISDRALTSALGINKSIIDDAAIVSPAFFNNIPQTDPMVLPLIYGKGTRAVYDPKYKVGQIGEVKSAEGTHYYVVLMNGLAQITPIVETIIQNYERVNPVVPMPAHDVVRLPTADYDISQFPVNVPTFKLFNTMCESWQYNTSDATATKVLYVQDRLPLTDEQISQMISYGTLKSNIYPTADQAYVKPGAGWFVMATNNDAGAVERNESLFFISDTGICYGVPSYEGISDGALRNTPQAMGWGEPLPAPAGILQLFPQGSVLSKSNALTEHSYIPPDMRQVPIQK